MAMLAAESGEWTGAIPPAGVLLMARKHQLVCLMHLSYFMGLEVIENKSGFK